MRNALFCLILLSIIACGEEKAPVEASIEAPTRITPVAIIGERIDGPANIRDKPNGSLLFELRDNVLVDAAPIQEDWLRVSIPADIAATEFGMDSIKAGRWIIIGEDTMGQVKQTHQVGTMQGADDTYAILEGYTHRQNIRPESIIEQALLQQLEKGQRALADWVAFREAFELRITAFEYPPFSTFFNYENSIEDPSPGFRIVLLFQAEQLVGFVHARPIDTEETRTLDLSRGYQVSFFEEFPKEEGQAFVDYMNGWLEGVD